VFCNAVIEELKMIDNLSRKAGTMRDYKAGGIGGEAEETGVIIYPGEYEAYYESS
jgi:hypothetical protein